MIFQKFLQQETIRIRKTQRTAERSIFLTGSKSESNRALALQCLSEGLVRAMNLSNADDTQIMINVLQQLREHQRDEVCVLDIGPAGTVMRFMTAILTLQSGKFLLTGSARMKQRPIKVLVDALIELGAKITYTENNGFPPILIEGPFTQKNVSVRIAGDISSQYLSALLMIAPLLPQGLNLTIEGKLTSKPYVNMTLDLLTKAGIQHSWKGDSISIAPQSFSPTTIQVEPDWSAASYWYSLLALRGNGELQLPGLKANSLQGDRAIANLMEPFGVMSTYSDAGIQISTIKEAISSGYTSQSFSFKNGPLLDFTTCPDLAQTVIACAAALRLNLSFTGLHTLRIKETDRIAALQQEIAKFGVRLVEEEPVFHLDCSGFYFPKHLHIDTYEDHRMAMAFAPLVEIFGELEIAAPKVVEKSYPDFWVHMQQQGFEINN